MGAREIHVSGRDRRLRGPLLGALDGAARRNLLLHLGSGFVHDDSGVPGSPCVVERHERVGFDWVGK